MSKAELGKAAREAINHAIVAARACNDRLLEVGEGPDETLALLRRQYVRAEEAADAAVLAHNEAI